MDTRVTSSLKSQVMGGRSESAKKKTSRFCEEREAEKHDHCAPRSRWGREGVEFPLRWGGPSPTHPDGAPFWNSKVTLMFFSKKKKNWATSLGCGCFHREPGGRLMFLRECARSHGGWRLYLPGWGGGFLEGSHWHTEIFSRVKSKVGERRGRRCNLSSRASAASEWRHCWGASCFLSRWSPRAAVRWSERFDVLASIPAFRVCVRVYCIALHVAALLTVVRRMFQVSHPMQFFCWSGADLWQQETLRFFLVCL